MTEERDNRSGKRDAESERLDMAWAELQAAKIHWYAALDRLDAAEAEMEDAWDAMKDKSR